MIKPLVAGTATALILQVSAAAFAEITYRCCMDPASAPPLWYAAVSSPIGALASLLPGFVAGWMAQRKAILVGFLVGLLGNVIYSAIFLTQWGAVVEGGPLTVAEVALRLVFLGVSWGLGSAAAAGTAQFLRSNKPIHATCEDARA